AAELATPPIVDEENAVIELRKAAGLFTAYSTSNQNWKKYQQGDFGFPFTARERPLAQAVVRENGGIFDLLDAAMAKEAFYWPNHPATPLISWLLPDLAPQRS